MEPRSECDTEMNRTDKYNYLLGLGRILVENFVGITDESSNSILNGLLVVIGTLDRRLSGTIQNTLDHRIGAAFQRNNQIDRSDCLLECFALAFFTWITIGAVNRSKIFFVFLHFYIPLLTHRSNSLEICQPPPSWLVPIGQVLLRLAPNRHVS